MNLKELLERLDSYSTKIPIDELDTLLTDLDEDSSNLESFTEFNDKHYQRNLVRRGASYEALLICWKSGQRSMIHDHVGSNCALKIISGSAYESIFIKADNGMIVPSTTHVLESGKVYSAVDNDIHQISNLQSEDKCLISFHVYSPMLTDMNVYSLTNPNVRHWHEPVVELMHGAGI